MSISKAYQCFYYQLYRSVGIVQGDSWWREGRAYVLLSIFEYLFFFSLIIYYEVLVNVRLNLPKTKLGAYIFTGIFFGIISLLNYIAFIYKDRWKDIVAEFDQLPKKKNRLGGWVVFGVVLAMLFSLVFAFYLLSRVGVNRVS